MGTEKLANFLGFTFSSSLQNALNVYEMTTQLTINIYNLTFGRQDDF